VGKGKKGKERLGSITFKKVNLAWTSRSTVEERSETRVRNCMEGRGEDAESIEGIPWTHKSHSQVGFKFVGPEGRYQGRKRKDSGKLMRESKIAHA